MITLSPTLAELFLLFSLILTAPRIFAGSHKITVVKKEVFIGRSKVKEKKEGGLDLLQRDPYLN